MATPATSAKTAGTSTVHEMPFVRIELVVLAVDEGRLQALLGQRAEAPHGGRWALPGGVLRIDKDTSLDSACQRVARERLGVGLPDPQQVTAVGGRWRDPRAPWALSVVYASMVRPGTLQVAAGKRLIELRWVDAAEATGAKLAFDHASLLDKAVQQLRQRVAALQFPAGMVDPTFTLSELQSFSEAVLGRPLDKSGFRRRLDAAGVVEPVPGEMRTGPNRPAQLFTLAKSQSASDEGAVRHPA